MGGNVARFDVLPGVGWDNLQNRVSGMLVHHNFVKCRTTDDGKYLIPDSVFTVPIKSSQLEIFGEMFQHWNNYTATTSTTINVQAGLQLEKFGINGKFSHESKNVRKNQIMDKSATTRVQARYTRYSAKLQPDTPLNPAFKNHLKNIAYYIQTNKTNMARYESQLLVRDFGTHIISSIDAGAVIAQMDEVESTLSKNGNMDSRQIVAAASASFLNKFIVNSEYKQSTSKEVIDQYVSHRTHSRIETFGGPVFHPNNFTVSQWAAELGLNLVSVDKSGFPIYHLISTQTLPDLPPSIIYPLVKTVKEAVEEYYKFNIYRGCINMDSPNFNFIANVDDGTCENAMTNYTFGGVFQECNSYESVFSGLSQKNPLTGGYSCPSGYEPVLLTRGRKCSYVIINKHRDCGFLKLFDCWDDTSVKVCANYQAYWCFARGHAKQQSGFQFGGIYTSSVDNPLTQSDTCPPYFYPLNLGEDMKICVSDDYELGFRYSVPFAGLFSCRAGNPLNLNQEAFSKNREPFPLFSYLKSSSPQFWPRGCPRGYSMQLANIENSCEINYCLKAHSFVKKGLPPLRRPPFMELPGDAYGISGGTNRTRQVLKENESQIDDDSGKTKLVGIVIGVLTAIITITVVIAMLVRRRRSRRRSQMPKNPNQEERDGTRGQSKDTPQSV
ncbi:macrophage-expressed gene 1 protein-like [Saccostrea cucullata]|uniref:macrophage-expressed gene 1 protein-like n=1 Tax=Saccostrea cuccullata TaxID=36930 RepID=UPI002ED163A8